MRILKRSANQDTDCGTDLERQPTVPFDSFLEIIPIEVFHLDECKPVPLIDRMNLNDIGMMQFCRDSRFGLKPLETTIVYFRLQDLDDPVYLELVTPGQINSRHPPPADHLRDRTVPDFFASGGMFSICFGRS